MSDAVNQARQRIRASPALLINSVAQLVKGVLQATFFVLLARLLGAADYGIFAAMVATAAIVSPFASLGVVNLLIRNVAWDQEARREQLATSWVVILISGSVVSVLFLVFAHTIIDYSGAALVALAVVSSDLLFLRLTEAAAFLFQAMKAPKLSLYCNVLPSLCRVLAISVLLAVGARHSNLAEVAGVYFWAGVSSVVLTVGLVLRNVGLSRPDLARLRREYRQGLLFAVGMSSQTIYNDLDKVMLTKLGSSDANGIYSAAYRLVDTAFLPARAVLNACYPRFFELGAKGPSHVLAFGKRLLKPMMVYGCCASLVLFVASPMVPIILGREYSRSASALRDLSILPLLKSLHYTAADTLTGMSRQAARTLVQVGVAVLNVGLNLILIPRYSWHGAVWSSVASDGALALGLWIVLGMAARSNAQGGRPHAPGSQVA